MGNIEIMFSSKKHDWSTPQDFFNELDNEFHFDIDVCADESNAKCQKYFDENDDGLIQNWEGMTCFCNPPYGFAIKDWVRKCYFEGSKPNTTVVMLIPARTDTKYFHEYIYKKAEIRFIKGRLKFGDSKNAAPFPSMVVIFRGPEEN